jgi:hypothetical protein
MISWRYIEGLLVNVFRNDLGAEIWVWESGDRIADLGDRAPINLTTMAKRIIDDFESGERPGVSAR